MKPLIPFILFIAIFLVVDIYAFKALKLLAHTWQKAYLRQAAYAAYWISSVVVYVFIAFAIYKYNRGQDPSDYFLFFMGFGLLMLVFMPKLVVAFFHLFDDLIHIFRRVAAYFIRSEAAAIPSGQSLTRWQFLTRIGWLLAALPFAGILYGIVRGRFQFRIEKIGVASPQLPEWAKGLRIVHISDIHIGSFFNNHHPVIEGIRQINALEPDLILFTGDMVNNYAEELEGWEEILGSLKARHGKFSVLGNHDYGDYVQWSSGEARTANLERLKKYHEQLGFKLLMNEKIEFALEDGQSPVEIIGVENWGAGGFSKYGKLNQAMQDTRDERFQILLSHDPSHWDAEVMGLTQVNLTLAGHTHGMQFGVEIPGLIKWSPVKYRYPRWGGLYTEGNQHLYVNRGFGYIGFPGRIGMPPEITVIELG